MDRRIGKTKNAIRKAYFELLKDKSHKKISITEVANRANIDRKTFYLHYESTDEILGDLCEQTLLDALNQIDEPRETADPEHIISELLKALTDKASENLDMFKVLYSKDEGRLLFEKLKRILIELIQGEIPDRFGFTETEFRLYLEFYLSGITSVYSLWLTEDLPMTLDELCQTVTGLLLSGIDGLMKKR